ncbi:MAG: chemotaxis protein [Oscillospiraceae bacterium]|nr:chemotaxis protein [Oscillospiraceae bacterium]
MKKEHIQAFLEVAPYLGDIINEDINIGVMDSKQYLLTVDGRTVTSNQTAGDPNTYDEFALSTIRERRQKSFEDVSDRFPFPVEVTFTPVIEENGNASDILIAVVKNIDRRKKADTASKAVSSSFEQANQTISEIAEDSQNLLQNIDDILKYTRETQQKLSVIDTLISRIKKIALQSNILAINAGIEAVHAGTAGKGFSVIAGEMGKLSKSSDEAAETANTALTEIKTAIDTITSKMVSIDTYSENQAASTQEISASINNIFNTFRLLSEHC